MTRYSLLLIEANYSKITLALMLLGFIFQILDILFQLCYISNDFIMPNLLQSAIKKMYTVFWRFANLLLYVSRPTARLKQLTKLYTIYTNEMKRNQFKFERKCLMLNSLELERVRMKTKLMNENKESLNNYLPSFILLFFPKRDDTYKYN